MIMVTIITVRKNLVSCFFIRLAALCLRFDVDIKLILYRKLINLNGN
jgi:hypothetical protein